MSRKELAKHKTTVEGLLAKATEAENKAGISAAVKAAKAELPDGVSWAQFIEDQFEKISHKSKVTRRKKRTKKSAGPKSVPKFANPANPLETWAGKGRQPNWYRAEIAKGTKPEEMEIKSGDDSERKGTKVVPLPTAKAEGTAPSAANDDGKRDTKAG